MEHRKVRLLRCPFGYHPFYLRNWYHIDIELANSDAGKLLFTGTIDRYGSPNTILKSISKVTGLTIIQSSNHYTIK